MRRSFSRFNFLSPFVPGRGGAVLSIGLLVLLIGCSRFPSLSPEEISSRIQSILELATVEYRYREIVYVGEQKSFLFIPTSSKEVLFSVEVRVQAGIDLNQPFTVEPDPRHPRKIHIHLPSSRILLVDVDEGMIRQYFLSEQGSRIHRMEYAQELEAAKQRILQDARKRGILSEADHQARILIKGILEAAGFEEVVFP
ncbi:MAG: hypothetical protein Kow009_01710 [Spirochaetales bacterium]